MSIRKDPSLTLRMTNSQDCNLQNANPKDDNFEESSYEFHAIGHFFYWNDIMRDYYVYILSNVSKTLYIGVTNNLEVRLYQHKNKLIDGFTKKYNLSKLVYFETTTDITSAIAREKQLKGLLRSKKIALIEENNPEWDDLSLLWNL